MAHYERAATRREFLAKGGAGFGVVALAGVGFVRRVGGWLGAIR